MLVTARVVGVIHMIDDDESDDKILAVYDVDPRFEKVQDLEDIAPHTIEELRHFFETYKELQGKKVEVLEIKNKDVAYQVLERSISLYKEKFGQ